MDLKKAFTLAEVLITLGIIGVVAAMTLPTLVQKQQEKVTVTRLKKAYSILSQAYMLIEEKEGTPDEWNLGERDDANTHRILAKKFIPYLKITTDCTDMTNEQAKKACHSKYYSTDQYADIKIADGTTIIFRIWNNDCNGKYGTTKQLQNVCGRIAIDINGNGNPDTYGIDIFAIYLTKYGLYPVGTEFDNKIAFNTHCRKSLNFGSMITNYTNGMGCTAWVLYNENMNYQRCDDLSWNGKTNCN